MEFSHFPLSLSSLFLAFKRLFVRISFAGWIKVNAEVLKCCGGSCLRQRSHVATIFFIIIHLLFHPRQMATFRRKGPYFSENIIRVDLSGVTLPRTC